MTLTPALLADAAARGPRYTSYPPATEMRPLAPAALATELAAVGGDGPISLYVHIPFCKQLCAYCGCNVVPTRDRSRGDAYVESVATELALLGSRIGAVPVTELALGGGSPNFLTAVALQRLVAAVRHRFPLAPDARLSVELDPRDTDRAKIDALSDLGFRALSVGVQDFAAPVQDAIRRHQSRAQTAATIDAARAAGFTDVNIDMVYGLPHQTEATFAETLDAVLQLAPDRIALFGYAHLPDRFPHQRLVERSGPILDAHERAVLLLLALQRLGDAGYQHLGLDHFARPGSALARAAAEHRMTRTFQGYVERRAASVIGVGASAISVTPRALWQNHASLESWQRALAGGDLPIVRGYLLDRDDQIRRAVIDELMCYGEVAFGPLGISASSYFAAELLQLRGLAVYDAAANVLRTTELGRLLVRNVCMAFDRHLAATGARFSATI
ncbi:MAG TPA: oxygen-independent coproporphyrinogen III oxidase [Kofleriaceae bacterium]